MGVYLVRVHIAGEKHSGMMNFGVKPTIGGTLQPLPEVHIFNFDRNIYNLPLRIEFLERIRDEKKFDSVEQLKEQIGRDKTIAEQLLLTRRFETN
jgi:riboflavin kinase/FMN adenylyltransferase